MSSNLNEALINLARALTRLVTAHTAAKVHENNRNGVA